MLCLLFKLDADLFMFLPVINTSAIGKKVLICWIFYH
jgi:hypothetical protein